jgi:hypothetical protein
MTSDKRDFISAVPDVLAANIFYMVASMMTGPVNRPTTASLRRKQLIA